MQNNAVFVRLDSFLERCHDIWDLSKTVMQFTKLAKIEVGGTKGKTLTTSVNQIYFDFTTAITSIKTVDYDIMDLAAKQFEDAYYEFRGRIKELERRLGSVITQVRPPPLPCSHRRSPLFTRVTGRALTMPRRSSLASSCWTRSTRSCSAPK